jgi:hypothetical protein
MGAFGENTMSCEQWLQFVLVPRLRQIVRDQDRFPPSSALAAYAVRTLDGDRDSGRIHEMLDAIDRLVDHVNGRAAKDDEWSFTAIEMNADATSPPPPPSVSVGDDTLPAVVYSLLEVLPLYEGDDLESQLQTYDTFLEICSPAARRELSALLMKAAAAASRPGSRVRIRQAAESVARGRRTAEPYDHDAAMRKYRDEHARAFKRRDAP